MKKSSTLIFVLTLALLSLSFYKTNKSTENSQITQTPSNIIPILDADAMYTGYGADRAAFLESNLTKKSSINTYDATRVIVMDYAQLKTYMAYIESESSKAGITIEDLGIYLSKYPDDGRMPSGARNTGAAGVESIFLNPMTTFSGSSNSVGYAVQQNAQGRAEAIPVGHVIDTQKGTYTRGAHSFTIQNNVKSLAANKFGHRPPPNTNGNGY